MGDADYAKQLAEITNWYRNVYEMITEESTKNYLDSLITEDMSEEQKAIINELKSSPNMVEDTKLFFDFDPDKYTYVTNNLHLPSRAMGKSHMFTELYGGNPKTFYGYDLSETKKEKKVKNKPLKQWENKLPHEQPVTASGPSEAKRLKARRLRKASQRL